jgi:hypothetical protein
MTTNTIKNIIADMQSPASFSGIAQSPFSNRASSPTDPENGALRAGLLYVAADLEQLVKIATSSKAAELAALSRLIRALANP